MTKTVVCKIFIGLLEILVIFLLIVLGHSLQAQIFDCIKKQNPKLEIDLKNGNFLPIINWLKKNIHSHGNYYKIDELLLNVTGEKLNLKYFEKHITDRYLKEKK